MVYERLPFFCFLCGIIGHGEEDCPTRYEEGFSEPERGFPYGSWMRVHEENRRALGTMNSNSIFKSPGNRAPLVPRVEKKGADIFVAGVAGNQYDMVKENWQPNMQVSGYRAMATTWRKDVDEGSVNSSTTGSMGMRRHIIVPNHKRKAIEGMSRETKKSGKRPQLQLRDEEMTITAETAQQSCRDQ